MFRALLFCRVRNKFQGEEGQEMKQVVTVVLGGLATILVFLGSVTKPSRLRRQCTMVR